MEQLATALMEIVNAVKANMVFSLEIIAALWVLHILNWLWGYRLNVLGICPRRIYGLPGIFFSPFLHGNFNHIFFNSVPLFVLVNLMMLYGRSLFYWVTFLIVLLSGFAVWLFGKRGIHIGASGVIMGYFGYLLSQAYFKLTAVTLILAVLCLYYFGGLLLALLPSTKKEISWEGHVFGFLAGIAAAYLWPMLVR